MTKFWLWNRTNYEKKSLKNANVYILQLLAVIILYFFAFIFHSHSHTFVYVALDLNDCRLWLWLRKSNRFVQPTMVATIWCTVCVYTSRPVYMYLLSLPIQFWNVNVNNASCAPMSNSTWCSKNVRRKATSIRRKSSISFSMMYFFFEFRLD